MDHVIILNGVAMIVLVGLVPQTGKYINNKSPFAFSLILRLVVVFQWTKWCVVSNVFVSVVYPVLAILVMMWSSLFLLLILSVSLVRSLCNHFCSILVLNIISKLSSKLLYSLLCSSNITSTIFLVFSLLCYYYCCEFWLITILLLFSTSSLYRD